MIFLELYDILIPQHNTYSVNTAVYRLVVMGEYIELQGGPVWVSLGGILTSYSEMQSQNSLILM